MKRAVVQQLGIVAEITIDVPLCHTQVLYECDEASDLLQKMNHSAEGNISFSLTNHEVKRGCFQAKVQKLERLFSLFYLCETRTMHHEDLLYCKSYGTNFR